MSANNRPLSPFMIGPYYKPQMTSVLSITHRITGAALVVGTLLLVYWLSALAMGPEAYAHAQAMLGSMFGQLLMFLWTWALFYHVANGIRHLFWDAGYGFELEEATKSGWMVVWSSIALTLLFWIIIAP
ncbi:MAG: succinate dehydrogenase, cytochrome b556 subunit [Candidatus Contendobacter odensis]|uniref:Succinate dehydrogenase cytochrome b556 subunit n=1 Tax=Candidatus Contendibacter odensensis TaxID=1400860 RepID=A0A2G6PEV1_9GAMM|nr:MAG: succinate dehydrogenase, cytochrome b556 subunit [Candidatus Contendobacter odensis]